MAVWPVVEKPVVERQVGFGSPASEIVIEPAKTPEAEKLHWATALVSAGCEEFGSSPVAGIAHDQADRSLAVEIAHK